MGKGSNVQTQSDMVGNNYVIEFGLSYDTVGGSTVLVRGPNSTVGPSCWFNNFAIHKNFIATFLVHEIRYRKYTHGNVKTVCKNLS